LTLRKKEVVKKNPKGTILGPFPSAFKTKEVLKIVRKIFKWCQNPTGDRACFYRHLDLCSGACTGEITKDDYEKNLKNLTLFLRGKKKQVVTNLQKEMLEAAQNEEFEKAQVFKDQIDLISEVTKQRLSPDLVLPQLQLNQNLEGAVRLAKILQDYMGVPKTWPMTRIEGYDVSNIQGTNPAVSMVTFIDAQSDTDEYRLFNIKSLNTPNDFAMMAEALTRRQKHPEWGKPSMVMIDGGRGQVRAVLSVWKWGLPVIGLEKNPDRLVLPVSVKKGSNDKLQIEWKILKLEDKHPSLNLLRQVRDEAHRFAQKQHKLMRTKKMFE
jgi:excinuclease ABC subunit C